MEGGIELPISEAAVERFERVIRRLPDGPLAPADVVVEELRLFGTWDMACYYAPLDFVDPGARVVLVATCPPLVHAVAAHAAAREALAAGHTRGEAWRRAAVAAGPRGSFETNLANMLDGLGLADALDVRSLRGEIGRPGGLVQVTYCIRYPVLVNDRDYTGRRPRLLRSPHLRPFVDRVLAVDLEAIPDAIVVPLGRIPGEAVATLVEQGRVDLERCLFGVPNPSGANGHREDDYERSREELALQVSAWFDDHPVSRAEAAPTA